MDGEGSKSSGTIKPWKGDGLIKEQDRVEQASRKDKREAWKTRSHSFSQEQKRTLQRALTIQEEKEKQLECPEEERETSSSDEENDAENRERAETIVAKCDKNEVDSKQAVKPIPRNEKQRTTAKPTTNNEKRNDMEEFQSLARKKKKSSRCWSAAQEIMSSERNYVDVLKILDEFRKRIEKKISKTSEEGARIYQMNLFTILPQLLMLNSMLLEEFEKRIGNWFTQPKIADVLVKKGGFLRIYSTYMDTFENTGLIFEECLKKYKDFAKIVKDIEKLPMCQALGLSMHLLAPVQRLPRYKLLLETYLKYQEENGEDFEDTKKAIEIVSSATKDSNKGLQERELMERMKNLHQRCEPFELIKAGRHLLREGRMMNVTNWEVPQPCHAILVTDSFFLASHKVVSTS